MKLRLPFKEYLRATGRFSNKPLDLFAMCAPFGIQTPSFPAQDILMGHLLDALAEEFEPQEMIDCMDVARVAWDLDYAPADRFLADAPNLVWQVMESFHR